MLKLLLTKTEMFSSLFLNKEGQVYRSVTVKDDGSVTFGTSNWRWCNLLFGDEITISFVDLSLKLIDKIASRNVSGDLLFEGLTKEVITYAIRNNQLDYVFDAFFDNMRNNCECELSSKYVSIKNSNQSSHSECGYRGNTVATVRLPSGESFGTWDVELRSTNLF